MRNDFKTMDIVELEMPTCIGRIQLAGGTWNHPIDQPARMTNHHLELSVLAEDQSTAARGRFIDYWSADHFAPFGGLFFLPAGSGIHFKSQVRHRQSLVCEFLPGEIEELLERDLCWNELDLENILSLNNATIRHLFNQIYQEIRSPGFASQLMLDSLSTQIAIALSRYVKTLGDEEKPGKLASWRMRLIDQRLEDITSMPTQEELAELCCLSVRHLCRAFRDSRQQTLGSYVAEHRANQAKTLIADGMSIKSVAYTMGFSAPSNFTRAFYRITGETPNQFRQRILSRKRSILIDKPPKQH